MDGVLQRVDEPLFGEGVARAVSLYYGSFKSWGMKEAVNQLFGDSGEQLQHRNMLVKLLPHLQRPLRLRHDEVFLICHRDSYLGQRWVVVRLEGVEVLCAYLRAAVAAIQAVLEEHTHLWYHQLLARHNLQRADDVLTSVAAQHAERQLASRKHHRLAQVLEHETQSRCGVCHRVGAVKHQKSVVVLILPFYYLSYIHPHLGRHVRRVDDVLKLTRVNLVVAHFQLRHSLIYALESKRVKRAVLPLHHADGAASVDYKYLVLHIMHINTNNKRHDAAFIFPEIFIIVNFASIHICNITKKVVSLHP